MVLIKLGLKATSWCVLIICIQCYEITGLTQDQTSTRPNTLLDDSDDIQRQLDNEARDRINYGRPKTIWVLKIPTQIPVLRESVNDRIKREPGSSRQIFPRYRRKACSRKESTEDETSSKEAINCKWLPCHTCKKPANCTEERRCKEPPCGKEDPYYKDLISDEETTTCKEPTGDEEVTSYKKVPYENVTSDKKDSVDLQDDWSYGDPTKWCEKYPHCGGRSQSPVDLPVTGQQKVVGARKLRFCNYDVMPQKWVVQNDGKRVMLFGNWTKGKRPLVQGGAAHSRRYLFHCLILHWPSEHAVGGFQYPMEVQALHMSADYGSFEQAVDASARDPQAFLGIVTIYKFGSKTQPGLQEILKMAVAAPNDTAKCIPLSSFVPVFKSYACYQGSLTFPPCTESVLWLVRPKALSITRGDAEAAHCLFKSHNVKIKHYIRPAQPLNDRKVYYFK